MPRGFGGRFYVLAKIKITCARRTVNYRHWPYSGTCQQNPKSHRVTARNINDVALAFALTIRTVGLALAGPLVAMISGAASPETRWKQLLVFAIVVTALSIGLFRYVLNLPIPILIIPGVLVL